MEPPASSQQLLQQATSAAVPCVFRGLNSNATWPALGHWSGADGLRHLQAVAGHAEVQAMVSASSEFFGDFEHHQEVTCTFGELLTQAQQQQQQPGQADAGRMHLYLAQQPLEGPVLSQLRAEVPTPPLLAEQQLTSVNLWFSSSSSRSSLHYDPYENLLCVVTGSKRVRLYSPAAVLGLYPKPLGGEASNHSCVDFARPDLQQHPLYRHVQSQVVCVELFPGDALYIPEGWWHQVDSAGMTFAVNFWWDSQLSHLLQAAPHQHHYLLRQLLSATSSEAVQLLLASIQPWAFHQEQQQQQQHHQEQQQQQQKQQQRQHHQEQQQQQQKQQQRWRPDEGQGAPSTAHKRPRLDTSTVPRQQQQQQQQGADIGVGECLTQFEAQALAVLTAGPGVRGEQVQQQQVTAAEQEQAGATESETAAAAAAAAETAGAGSSSATPCTGLLVSDAWWAQQSTCQQQLLAAAVADSGIVSPNQQELQQQEERAVWRSAGTSGDVLGLADPVSRVLAALQPGQLLRVLRQGSTQNPKAIGQLLLHGLSPAAAQLLTQGFEAADSLFAAADVCSSDSSQAMCENIASSGSAKTSCRQDVADPEQQSQQGSRVVLPGGVACCSRQEFYGRLYGTVRDPAGVLQVLLREKTRLTAAATGVVLKAQLGRRVV